MRRIGLSVVVLVLVIWATSQGQDVKFTALFVYNFAKYVEWPDASAGEFVITVLGDDPVVDELKTIAAKETEQKLVIRKCLSLDQVDKCSILYISPDKSNLLPSAVSRMGATPTLIVTNKSGLVKEGSSINFIMVDGKLRYEVNAESLKKAGLKAKPVLFKLAKATAS